ncbi:MAG: hypothetical protein EXQ50_05705 [Acidobacteria bacterium]|nr:hypothetical protein [Acidobacteriota bacterium]
MAGRECYHCKQWVDEGQDHDCWTTTEAELTADLSEDLREAWERLRQALAELGEQRIYASGACIMFARETVYCFVRPKRSFLEVSVFLGRALKSAQVKRVETRSKTKVANVLKITHRDAVEPPVTDWFREAYEHEGKAAIKRKATAASKKRAQKKSRPRVSRKFL